jgi:hypothetical protein
MNPGFNPTSQALGTPVDADLRRGLGPPSASLVPCFPNNNEGRLVQALWNDPTATINSRLAAFTKQPTVLQGLVLTKPPTGGFGVADRTVVVSAAGNGGGPEVVARLDCNPGAYFLQPGYPDRVVEVGPADALAVSDTQPPYRVPTGCGGAVGAVGSGVMSVARMDAEIAARKAADQAALDAMDPPVYTPPPSAGPGPSGPSGGPSAGAGPSTVATQRRPDGAAQPFDMRALEVTAGSGPLPAQCTSIPGAWGAIKHALVSWAHAFGSEPFQASTWTTNDAWVCLFIIALLFVGFVLAMTMVGKAITKSRKRRGAL